MNLTTKQFAEKVNKTPSRVIQLIYEKVINAEKLGRDWIIDDSQLEIVNNLPDNRGKYDRKNRKTAAPAATA